VQDQTGGLVRAGASPGPRPCRGAGQGLSPTRAARRAGGEGESTGGAAGSHRAHSQNMPAETTAAAEPEVIISESEQHKKDGNMHFASADYVKAVAAYNKAIKADPNNGVLYRCARPRTGLLRCRCGCAYAIPRPR